MSSIGGILSTARTAIFTSQTAIQIASNNISNAQTEGYSRQRALVTALTPLRTPYGSIGTGVTIRDVTRIREDHHDLSVRRESANASGFGIRKDILMHTESILGEPSENGLAATLDLFWSAWSDLSNSPDNPSAKNLVRQRGIQIVDSFHRYGRQLGELEDSTVRRMEAQVGELNNLVGQVAELNGRIRAAEAAGTTAGDLRDARDLAIDRAARIADVRVIPQKDGTISVALGSINLTSGADAIPLSMSTRRGPDGRVLGVTFSVDGVLIEPIGSALQGAADGLADVRDVRDGLDQLAAHLVREVNTRHSSTPPSLEFFDDPPGGVTAANFRLSDAILQDAGNVVIGTGGTDNSIALSIAAVRDLQVPLTDGDGNPRLDSSGNPVLHTLGGIYRDLVTSLAIRASDAERSFTAAETLAQQAQARRESVSGVSVDEELIELMRHQQAYAAATKLVGVADEMLQTLLSMV